MGPDRVGMSRRGGARGAALAIAWIAGLLLLAGCHKPEPPPTEQPPEPQAASGAAAPDPDTRLRDAIQAPQDRARAVEGVVEDAAARRRAEIEAQAGDGL